MRILVTNDDGIDAPGIQELARRIERAGHEVVVVAPDHNASGTGASLGGLGPGDPVRVSKRRIDGLEGEAYALSGPPALCVMAGNLEAFGPRPEGVVSGINAGLNTGRSALHSGTLGAALAGQNFGYRSLAVSLDNDREADRWHWGAAAEIAVSLLPHVLEGPSRLALSLNVPGLPRDRIRGICWTRLATFGSRPGRPCQKGSRSAPHRVAANWLRAGSGYRSCGGTGGLRGNHVAAGCGGGVGIGSPGG